MLLKSGRSRSSKLLKSIKLPKSWSAAVSMPDHDCAFALSIAFAEPLPEESSKWAGGKSLDLRSASNFFAVAGGAAIRCG